MAENDINNEEQYKIAANKLIEYYKNNKPQIYNIFKKENKNSSLDDLEDKSKIKRIYNNFKNFYSLEELKKYTDEDILNKYIFTKGNKDNLCYKLEYAIKVGGIGQASVFIKYGLCKNETGWHLGSSSKNSESINKERAIKEGKKQIELIVKGGRVIEKYIKENKLYNLANYDELDSELWQETSEFSTKPWVRKYYHLLFPEYFCNWFSDNKLSDVLTKLGIANQSKTYYGKCGQLMKIYKNTGLDNPVLVMFVCVALLNIENEDDENEDSEEINENSEEKNMELFSLNQILYGPPGTGKTYNTVIKSMEIIDNRIIIKDKDGNVVNYDEVKEEFDKAKKEGKIEFITFHQSYAYEEFIEGIKPVVSNDFECENDEINNNGEIKYKIDEGVFKRICNKAITAKLKKDNSIKDLIRSDASVWKVTIRDVVKQDCFGNNRVRIDYDFETKEAKKFNELIDKGDIILSTNGSRSKINGIAIVNNDEAIKLDSSEDQTSRDVIWLVKDIDENITELNDNKLLSRNTFSRVPSMKASNILKLTLDLNGKKENKSNDKSEPYVLIIDEINRGNISKIFGELITLIEEDKRESFSVKLPYSHEEFTVPKNLYIIGTMNTSDRSIASIDIALRRRFTFKEMMPDSKLVADFGVEFSNKFKELNNRIRILLDRDHQIGHSYFIKTKYNNENNNNNIKTLKEIWFNCIMPLLNEYFYNDWEKLKLIIPGFIKPIDIPQNLKEECESAYEFKTIGDMGDDKAFIKALNQAEYKEKE